MKKFRKIMAVLVAAMMIMAMCVPAWAATNDDWGRLDSETADRTKGTITINNAEDGETYNLYKILSLYSFVDDDNQPNQHSKANEHYAYLVKDESDAGWDGFIKKYSTSASDSDTTNDYFIIDTLNPVKINSDKYFPVYSTDIFNFESPTAVNDEIDHAGSVDTANNKYKKVQLFAQDALAWAKTHASKCAATDTIAATDGATSTYGVCNNVVDGTTETGKVQIQFVGVPLGYYLIDSTLGTMVALDTTNRNVTMYDKNDNPTIMKKVRERGHDNLTRTSTNKYSYGDNFDTVWKENTDYEIGQKVTFLIRICVYKGAKGYSLYDVMERGFAPVLATGGATFDTDAFRVYKGTASEMTVVDKGDSTFNVITTGTDLKNCSFKVTFNDEWLAGLPDGSYIDIEYDTYLTDLAYVKGDANETDGTTTTTLTTLLEGGKADPGETQTVTDIKVEGNTDKLNTNSAILMFGQASSTKWDTATVETYQVDLVKTEEDKNDGTEDSIYKLLGTAQFELYKAAKDPTTGATTDARSTNKVTFIQNGTVYRVKRTLTADPGVEATDKTGTTTTLLSVNDGVVNIRGLEAGTYYLGEVYAPTGFHKLDGYYKIVITPNNDTANLATAGQISYTYANSDGTAVSGRASGAKSWDATASGSTAPLTYNSSGNGGVQVVNTTTTELPSTGGMGTTVLYIVGGMLVILAGAYLFFSRKRTA